MANHSESPANWYSTAHAMTTCGSDAGVTTPERLTFGFPATGLRVVNSCNDRIFFNLQTSATTDDNYVAACGEMTLDHMPPFSGFSLKTTSTATTGGLPVARPLIRVAAWGR